LSADPARLQARRSQEGPRSEAGIAAEIGSRRNE